MEHSVQTVERIERKILYPIVKGICILFALLSLAAMVLGTFAYFVSSNQETHKARITYNEVYSYINPEHIDPNIQIDLMARIEKKYKIPQKVRQYFAFTSTNSEVLSDWLSTINSREDKQDFLYNMGDIIIQAEQKHVDVFSYINSYAKLKLIKINEDSSMFNKYESMAQQGAIVGFIFFATMLFLIVIVILLIFDIEKNTRSAKVVNEYK